MTKFAYTLLVSLLFLVVGCRDRPEPDTPREDPPTREAHQPEEEEDRGRGYIDGLRHGLRAAADQQLAVANRTVEGFRALKGRNPNDLDELTAAGFALPDPPEGLEYRYDPGKGEITWEAKE